MRMQFGKKIYGPYNNHINAEHPNSKPYWKWQLNNEDDNSDARIRVLEAVQQWAPLKVQEAIISFETQVQGSTYTREEQTALANWKTDEGKYHLYEGSYHGYERYYMGLRAEGNFEWTDAATAGIFEAEGMCHGAQGDYYHTAWMSSNDKGPWRALHGL